MTAEEFIIIHTGKGELPKPEDVKLLQAYAHYVADVGDEVIYAGVESRTDLLSKDISTAMEQGAKWMRDKIKSRIK